MNQVSQFLENQTDEFLKVCFDELEAFRTSGILPNESEVRKLNEQFFNNNPSTLFSLGESIYREIAKRYFANKP